MAIVHLEPYNNLIYILEKEETGDLEGVFFDMLTMVEYSRIDLSQHFEVESGVLWQHSKEFHIKHVFLDIY